MRDSIVYAERLSECTVLGPFTRAVIWVSGCCFDCDGCIAQNFRHREGKKTTIEEMKDWILRADKIEGITISGGEPFLQAQALAETISLVRKEKDLGVIVYSGFTYGQLVERAAEDSGTDALLKCTDILIDGPYRKELDDNRPYVGSSNQNILLLTDRYADSWEKYYLVKKGRDIQVILTEGKSFMAGVPGKEQEEFWRKLNGLYSRK